jgi:hypothetical protein
MHSSLSRLGRQFGTAALGLAASVGGVVAQASPVGAPARSGASAVQRAESLLSEGRRGDAKMFLGEHLALVPTDGRAWFTLGRIHLGDAQHWHRSGHPTEGSGVPVVEFATSAFEQAHHLLADSASVYLVLAMVERTTLRIERLGWEASVEIPLPAEELPLPPVLAELGRNLMGSCPRGGVLITGSLVETAAVWGVRLAGGERADLVLVRPDLYEADAEYRGQMASAMGVDPEARLAGALFRASARRPICATPSVDSTVSASLDWHPLHLVLAAGSIATGEAPPVLSVHQLARTGLAGSVWSEAARDVYELAARRNRSLCDALLTRPDVQGLPAILACPR